MFELPNDNGPVRRALEKIRERFAKGITLADNMKCAILERPFRHGVEEEFDNPLGFMPLGFEPIEAWTNDNNRTPLAVLGSPEFNRLTSTVRKLRMTVEYDLRHTSPSLRRRATGGGVSAANATYVAVPWGVSKRTDPTGVLSIGGPANTRIIAAEAGDYAIFGRIVFDNNATGTRWVQGTINGALTNSINDWTVSSAPALADGNRTWINFYGEATLGAGEYAEAFAWQNSGGSLGVSGDSILYVRRIHNNTLPAGMVRGVLWGA